MSLEQVLKLWSKKDLWNRILEKNQRIADLEAKLAEKDNEIKILDEDRQFKAEMWTKFANKCKDLKQQLAEKEKERHEETSK